jgi:hypothetical protein
LASDASQQLRATLAVKRASGWNAKSPFRCRIVRCDDCPLISTIGTTSVVFVQQFGLRLPISRHVFLRPSPIFLIVRESSTRQTVLFRYLSGSLISRDRAFADV